MKTFPKPLHADEEKYYLKRCQDGDVEARNILVERNLRLVAHIVKKYQLPPEELEDYISIGTIGLMKAISTFNSDKNIRLATYAAKCIENELLMHFRSKKKSSREVSIYEPIGTDKEGNEIQLLDIIESEYLDIPEEMDKRDNIFHLYQILDKVLTPREQRVLILRYGLYGREACTQQDIADLLGISRSYISRIEKNAVEKLRKCFS